MPPIGHPNKNTVAGAQPPANDNPNPTPKGGLAAKLREAGIGSGKPTSCPKASAADGNPGPGSLSPPQVSQDSRVRQVSQRYTGIVGNVAAFLTRYIVLPWPMPIVVAAWVVAAWLTELWDRFPHLAITSPEKRCGKTTLLRLLELLTPNAHNAASISPAAMYRLIAKVQPTLLLDEAQSISRRGSEAAEVTRELLNAAIDKKAEVLRCVCIGKNWQVVPFPVYCPKVVALIGALDGVLADRCLPVEMIRKTEADKVEPYRSRVVEPIGNALREKLEQWVQDNRDKVAEAYDKLGPFPIQNDRMAELLLPLQAVLAVDAPDRLAGSDKSDRIPEGSESLLGLLRHYAEELDKKDREAEQMSPGEQLLFACREIFANVKAIPGDGRFLSTSDLIAKLCERTEEPWASFTRGGPITPEALANLLKPHHIRSGRNRSQTARGYFAHGFHEAWDRYLPPPDTASSKNPANSANPAGRKEGQR